MPSPRLTKTLPPRRSGEELVAVTKARHKLLKPSKLSVGGSQYLDNNEQHVTERILIGMHWGYNSDLKASLTAVFPEYPKLDWAERNSVSSYYRTDPIVLQYRKHISKNALVSNGLNPVKVANQSVRLMTRILFDNERRWEALECIGKHPEELKKLDPEVQDHISRLETKVLKDGTVVLANIIFHDIAKLARELLQLSILAFGLDQENKQKLDTVKVEKVAWIPTNENINNPATMDLDADSHFEETEAREIPDDGLSWDLEKHRVK